MTVGKIGRCEICGLIDHYLIDAACAPCRARCTDLACPACGNREQDGFHNASLGGREALSCEECGHVFDPVPTTDGAIPCT